MHPLCRLPLLFFLLACTLPPPRPPAEPEGDRPSVELSPNLTRPEEEKLWVGPEAIRIEASPGPSLPIHGLVSVGRISPIALENRQPGSEDWRLTRASRKIGAFVDRTSYLPGERVNVFAGSETATAATWELFRLGYYHGRGGRRMASGGPVPVPCASPAELDPALGSVRAPWPVAFTLELGTDVTTGVYLLKLATPIGQTYATWVVREPAPAAPILVLLPVNTYQAYNSWGGTSLYVNQRADWPYSHAFAASFERPYSQGSGAGHLFLHDRDFVVFAEGQGYDLAYATDVDLDAESALVQGRRLLVVQGHSEYWSFEMRQNLEAAMAQPSHVAFLGANDIYWQVRFAPNASGEARRVLIGYKDFASLDPAALTDPGRVTTRWRDPPVGRPENAISGVMFGSWLFSSSALFVREPSSWVFAGTNVGADTLVPGVYGIEVDEEEDNGAGPFLEILAEGTVDGYSGLLGSGQTALHTTASGAQVFAAGTITWSRSLAGEGVWDARIQQVTANLFSRLAGDGRLGTAALKPLLLPPGAPLPQYRPGVQVSTVTAQLTRPTAVASLPGGDAVVVDGSRILKVAASGQISLLAGSTEGSADGPGVHATFREPRGITAAPDGTVYVADTGNHRIRVISAAGDVRTLAGSVEGFAEGLGASAQFTLPMAIALGPTGDLFVADTWNHRIRRITPAGQVSTYAGTGTQGVSYGSGCSAELSFPFALAALPDGSLIWAESDTGLVRQISAPPERSVSVFAGALGRFGWNDGPLLGAGVSETVALATAPGGEVVLIDSATARIRAARAGVIDTLAGGAFGGLSDGPGELAAFAFPRGAALSQSGSLWVVDVRTHSLRRLSLP